MSMFDIDVAAWRELSLPLVLVFLTLVLGFLIVYGIGIGFNRQSAEPIFVDLSADSSGVKRSNNKKKKKVKPTKPAGKPDVVDKKRTEAVVSGQQKHSRPSAAVPDVTSPASVVTPPSDPAPAVTTKARVAETRRRDPEPWDQVVSRRQRRQQQQHEQEQRPDPARLEAAVIAQQERTAEDSTDSGIVNASPTKTKKKKSKNKKKDDVRKAESIPPPLNLIPVSEPKIRTKPLAAAKVISDQFTTVSKKKKSPPKSTQNTEGAVPVKPEQPKLTRDDFYSSGNGSRVLSLEEAMAALKSQTAVSLEPSAPHKIGKPAATPATAAGKTPVPTAAAGKKAPAPPADKVPAAAASPPATQLPGKPVPIEEMMARLRAGEDITQVSSPRDPAQLKPAAAAVHSAPAAATNVAFDELGDAWTEQAPKPKKKKKTRKE